MGLYGNYDTGRVAMMFVGIVVRHCDTGMCKR